MEKKNTILLTVIAVATLLVAVVGATFAYFTASTNAGTAGNTNTATTATTGTVSIPFAATDVFTYLNYPGGASVSGIGATASTTDGNTYNIGYKLNMQFTNETGTALTWTLYSSENPIETDPACQLQSEPVGEQTHYYYNNCQLSSYEDLTEVQTDTIAAGAKATTVTTTKTLTTQTGDSIYYYLVVEYPNSGDQTSTDAGGKTISAQITGATNVVATVVPAGD